MNHLQNRELCNIFHNVKFAIVVLDINKIHKSKTTYCVFADPTDCDYDMILPDVKKINKKNILEARKARAERLSKLAHEAAVLATGEKQKADQFEIKLSKSS